ncbi:MAG: hypothetical protein LBH53_02970 [Puniceicoccales bacterium]|jgi:hypothetical protein|nr:hypothetical protein [Puniceicoccales bacterium]
METGSVSFGARNVAYSRMGYDVAAAFNLSTETAGLDLIKTAPLSSSDSDPGLASLKAVRSCPTVERFFYYLLCVVTFSIGFFLAKSSFEKEIKPQIAAFAGSFPEKDGAAATIAKVTIAAAARDIFADADKEGGKLLADAIDRKAQSEERINLSGLRATDPGELEKKEKLLNELFSLDSSANSPGNYALQLRKNFSNSKESVNKWNELVRLIERFYNLSNAQFTLNRASSALGDTHVQDLEAAIAPLQQNVQEAESNLALAQRNFNIWRESYAYVIEGTSYVLNRIYESYCAVLPDHLSKQDVQTEIHGATLEPCKKLLAKLCPRRNIDVQKCLTDARIRAFRTNSLPFYVQTGNTSSFHPGVRKGFSGSTVADLVKCLFVVAKEPADLPDPLKSLWADKRPISKIMREDEFNKLMAHMDQIDEAICGYRPSTTDRTLLESVFAARTEFCASKELLHLSTRRAALDNARADLDNARAALDNARAEIAAMNDARSELVLQEKFWTERPTEESAKNSVALALYRAHGLFMPFSTKQTTYGKAVTDDPGEFLLWRLRIENEKRRDPLQFDENVANPVEEINRVLGLQDGTALSCSSYMRANHSEDFRKLFQELNRLSRLQHAKSKLDHDIYGHLKQAFSRKNDSSLTKLRDELESHFKQLRLLRDPSSPSDAEQPLVVLKFRPMSARHDLLIGPAHEDLLRAKLSGLDSFYRKTIEARALQGTPFPEWNVNLTFSDCVRCLGAESAIEIESDGNDKVADEQYAALKEAYSALARFREQAVESLLGRQTELVVSNKITTMSFEEAYRRCLKGDRELADSTQFEDQRAAYQTAKTAYDRTLGSAA